MKNDVSELNFARDLVAAARANGEPWASSWTESAIESEVEHAKLLVARDQHLRPVGFVFLRAPGHAWEITLVAVSPVNRGQGVFSVLIQQADKFRKTQSADSVPAPIDLEVRSDNKSAIQAYEKCGFKAIGRRERYYADGTAAILYRFE